MRSYLSGAFPGRLLSPHTWFSGPLSIRKLISAVFLLATSFLLFNFYDDLRYGGYGQPDYFTQQAQAYALTGGQRMTGKQLRILPLGDSITEGFGSSTGDGYRAVLYNLLSENGNTVTMIGSRKTGTMPDISHEGWGGFEILNIAQMKFSWVMRPNVVLLLAGANDALHDKSVRRAAKRVDDLVGALFKACPDATVLVGKLPPRLSAKELANAEYINAGVAARMAIRARKGQHVILVDFPATFDATVDIADEVHPNDHGYNKIAHAWAKALDLAADLGWIGTPVNAPDHPDANPYFAPEVYNGLKHDGRIVTVRRGWESI